MRRGHSPDYALALSTIALVVFGLIMVSSASVVFSFETTGSNNYYFFRQVAFALVGIGAWFLIQRYDYHRLKKWAPYILGVGIALLVAVLIPHIGLHVGGARRWIGIGPITLQASELAKLAVIIFLAYFFERNSRHIQDFRRAVVPFALLMVVLGVLIMAEPDLGTLGVIAAIALGMYWIAGAAFRHLAFLTSLALGAGWLLIKMAPYRLNRILAFLDPARDPLGIGYHVTQALVAVGSGGLLGLGFGHSRQKFNYLPQASSDSIFAVIAEELGFLRVIIILIVFAFLVWRGLRVARTAPDTFGRLLASGIVIWISVQTFVNIGSIIGLLPLTGVPLPLISLGGSSLVITLIALGILLNISKQTAEESNEEDPFGRWWNSWARISRASYRRIFKGKRSRR